MKRVQRETFRSAITTIQANRIGRPNWLAALGLNRFVALDLETTGLSATNDAIIEVGAVYFEEGLAKYTFQSFVNPQRPLPRAISALTGIYENDLVSAPLFEGVGNELLEFIGDAPVVGQNTSFDVGFLVASGGVEFRFPGKTVLDTAELARIFWAELPRFSLSSLSAFFGVKLGAAHRAVDDARATGEILTEIVKRLPDRVWGELSAEISAVAGQGHHRSELFFHYLKQVSLEIAVPERTQPQKFKRDLESISTAELNVGGKFKENLAHFSPRTQQLQMAKLVDRAFDQNHLLLLEAPTGTGKSIGYLIPALAWALSGDSENNRQVVVSSHTRSLQEQLLYKDIRDISRAMCADVPAAVLKGRENYLCTRRFRSALKDVDGRLSDGDRHKLLPLLRWSHLTIRGDIGEIGGFRPELEPVLWSMVCSDGAVCSGALCGSNRGDFYRQALDDAKRARILLVNHALMATDFKRFLGGEGMERRLVIDEAHQFERAVVSAYTITFNLKATRNTLSRLADERSARGLLTRLAKDIGDHNTTDELVALDVLTKSLFQLSRLSFQKAADSFAHNQTDEARFRLKPSTHLQESIEHSLRPLLDELVELSDRIDALNQQIARSEDYPRDIKERVLELRSIAGSLTELIESGKLVIDCSDTRFVYWIETSQHRSNPVLSLYAAPISIAETLNKALWSSGGGKVLTSATLAHHGTFAVIENALGINGTCEDYTVRATLDSPFNLKQQMRLFCPTFLPDAKTSVLHIAGVMGLLTRLMAEVNRSTLVLCTSHASADELTKQLTPIGRRKHRQIFQQKSGRDTHEVLKAFRESRGAFLIGSSSLWEGIDLVGDEMEILVVMKLPFDVPTEPWYEARSELALSRSQDPFYSISVPSCTTRLRQGLGRLIRHQNDRGVAIVTDSRLVATRYGRIIQRSLPVDVEPIADLEFLFKELNSFMER